ncbi:DNA-directed RNA polymerase subunit beta [Patescibacteria group bacterium]|nr:DNA-directed RNA polymerase subunit beta [Patescibacteria group bacterium]
MPNLSSVQLDSFSWFLKEGINEILDEISSIEDYTGRNWELNFSKSRIAKSTITIEQAIEKGATYSASWFLTATLKDKSANQEKSQEIYVGEIPMITPKGTFIINGIEKVVVSQLTRSYGVFFVSTTDATTGKVLGGAKILPKNGAWLEFETAKSGVITVKIDRKRKIAATTLLRVFGTTDDAQISKTFGDFIETTLNKDLAKSYNEALLEIYKKMRPGEPLVLENAKALVENIFFNPRRYSLGKVGRFKLNQRFGFTTPNNKDNWLLTKEDLVAVIAKVIELNKGTLEPDDIDSLSNRRVRSVGELLQMQVRVGFIQMERNIKERMSLQPRGILCEPQTLISTRPVQARVHSFFALGQLSQYQDQSNPLTGLDHLRRLSVLGPGGLSKERASFSVRDVHFSHYGRVCPVRTPEGPNIGLISYLSLFSRVNEFGFLETPYKKLVKEKNDKIRVTNEIVYMASYEEEKYFIADASPKIDKNGYVLDKLVPLRKGGEFIIGNIEMAEYMDINPQQVVGVAAALIPFLSNDDVNRALMGTQHATQAVPLIKPEEPLVGTGIESDTALNAGAVVIASENGTVEYADALGVVVKTASGEKKKYAPLKFSQSNMDTCFNQRVVVSAGDKVKKGEVLMEGPSSKNGVLSLGTNLKVGYMIWEGFNYEDSIILSERVVKEDILTSIHITDHTVQVLETKLGAEEITRDIPNVSEEVLRNLDEEGIVAIGSKVKSGDILVGKVAPKGESELSAEERLLRAIFGEKAKDVKNNSLTLPHGEYGTVIGVKRIVASNETALPNGVLEEITVFIAQQRKIMVGDKLSGRHGNKGVIAKIVPIEDMPCLEDGSPLDIILSPASVIARMNVGQLLEAHLAQVAEISGEKYDIPVFTKFTEDDLKNSLKKAGLPESGKVRLIDGRTGEYFDQEVVVGIAYILKLHHLAEDKMHARSIGPYSLITQQPLGGKAQFGGQRFGEMEVWALESYSAAHILKELLTIKSDDVIGRTLAYRSILQGTEIPESAVPESFKLLVRELNGLGLNITPLGMEEGEEIPSKDALEEAVDSAV